MTTGGCLKLNNSPCESSLIPSKVCQLSMWALVIAARNSLVVHAGTRSVRKSSPITCVKLWCLRSLHFYDSFSSILGACGVSDLEFGFQCLMCLLLVLPIFTVFQVSLLSPFIFLSWPAVSTNISELSFLCRRRLTWIFFCENYHGYNSWHSADDWCAVDDQHTVVVTMVQMVWLLFAIWW